MNTHERIDREEEVTGSSDRSFGLVFAGFFAIIAGLRAWKGEAGTLLWLGAASAFALVAVLRPAALAPANRAWLRLGLVLGRIVTPVVMLVLFAIAIVPFGLVMRLMGRDPLRLARDPQAQTYWQDHDATPRAHDRMRDQF